MLDQAVSKGLKLGKRALKMISMHFSGNFDGKYNTDTNEKIGDNISTDEFHPTQSSYLIFVHMAKTMVDIKII